MGGATAVGTGAIRTEINYAQHAAAGLEPETVLEHVIETRPRNFDPFNASVQVRDGIPGLFAEIERSNFNTQTEYQSVRKILAVWCMRACCSALFGYTHEMECRLGATTLKLDANGLMRLLAMWPSTLSSKRELEQVLQQMGASPNRPFSAQDCHLLGDPLQVRRFATGAPHAKATLLSKLTLVPLGSHKLQQLFMFLDRVIPSSLDARQQSLAERVIACLPVKHQGNLRNLRCDLIGTKAYAQVMSAAATAQALPPVLQAFWNNCASNRALQKAFLRNPALAAGLLGHLSAQTHTTPPVDIWESNLGQQMVNGRPKQVANKQIMQWIRNTFKSRTRLMFERLEKFAGFSTYDVTSVPSHFSNIRCPKSTAVKLVIPPERRQIGIHANHVKIDSQNSVIAAMQPVVTSKDNKEPNAENLNAFLHMATLGEKNVIFDLRTPASSDPRDFEYCPITTNAQVLAQTEQGQTVRIDCLNHQSNADGFLHEKKLKVTTLNQQTKELTVFRVQSWPDQGTVSPEKLRQLREQLDECLAQGAHVTVHCRAGVGRTGTLLAYAKAHRRLFAADGMKLLSKNGQIDRNMLLEFVATAVIEGRCERGQSFVQTPEQLELIVETLQQDIQQHQAKPQMAVADAGTTTRTSSQLPAQLPAQVPAQTPARTTAEAPPQSSRNSSRAAENAQPAQYPIWLNSGITAIISKEPKGQDERLSHWEQLLKHDAPVIEFVSNRERLAGQENCHEKGLSWITQWHLSNLGGGVDGPEMFIGSNRIDRIEQIQVDTSDAGLLEATHYRIHWTDFSNPHQPRARQIDYRQIYTTFDGRQLTADQLDAIINTTAPLLSHELVRLTSASGFGRTSAVLTAHAIALEIDRGKIADQSGLRMRLDDFIAKGRLLRGEAFFIHTPQQHDELLRFALRRLELTQAKAQSD